MAAYYHAFSCSSLIIILHFDITRQVKLPWKRYEVITTVLIKILSPLTYDAEFVGEIRRFREAGGDFFRNVDEHYQTTRRHVPTKLESFIPVGFCPRFPLQ